jgi:hypothetical protein
MKQYLALVLMLIFCSWLPAQQNGLPAIRPADFTLSFHFDGGMSYHFEEITITKDSCISKVNEQGKILVCRFKLSASALDSLYAMLQQNQFTQIEYRSGGQVYDRGGEKITIGWNNNQQRYTVNDSQNSFVQKAWFVKWNAIIDYVTRLAPNNKINFD